MQAQTIILGALEVYIFGVNFVDGNILSLRLMPQY